MNPFLRAPRLRWRVPSFLNLLGIVGFGFLGWTLYEAMEEEHAREVLFQPEAEPIERAKAAELWAADGVESLPRLKEALASDNASIREFGLLALIYMPVKDVAAVRTEVRLLCDDPDAGVQSNALVLMAKLTDEPEQFAAVAASRLISSDLELVDAGKTAIQRLGLPAVPAVVEVLPQVSPFVQGSCLDFLARYAFDEKYGPLATAAIAGSLQAEDDGVRELAFVLLSSIRPLTADEIGTGLKDPYHRIAKIAVSEAVRSQTPDLQNLQRLVGLLNTKTELRASALQAVAVYGSQATGHFADIQQWTQDSDPDVRLEAITTLVRITDDLDRVVPSLRELLLDSHPDVARRSARLLAEVAPEAVPSIITQVLLPRLSSRNVPTQVSAAAALSGMPEAAAAHRLTLIRLLANQSSDRVIAPAVQFQLTEALGNMGPIARDAVPVLLNLVQRTDWNDPQLIVPLRALGNIGPSDRSVVKTLLQLHERLGRRSRALRIVLLETLGKLGQGDAEVFDFLVERSREAHSPRERLAALRAMVACQENSDSTQALLILALDDEDCNIRLGAGLLLMEQGNVEELVPSLAVLLQDENPFVRLLAAHSLATLGPQARSAKLALVQTLDDPESQSTYYYEEDEIDWSLFDEKLQNLRRGSVHQAIRSALAATDASPHKGKTAAQRTAL